MRKSIRFSVIGAIALFGAVETASADVIVTLLEDGGNLVMSYDAGTLDTTGLAFRGNFGGCGNLFVGGIANLVGGGVSNGCIGFDGDITVTDSGSWTVGASISAFSSTTGDGGLITSFDYFGGGPTVFINDDPGDAFVGVNTLTGMTGTVNGASYASLGLTAGQWIRFSWGADSLTIQTMEILVEIDIDIKFCSNPNGFNCKSRGVTPVTIFGTPDLNVNDIDVSSLQLCLEDLSLCTTSPPKDSSLADRGDPTTDIGADQCTALPDVEQDFLNRDGVDDLDVAFYTQDVVSVIGCDGLSKGDASPTLILIGETNGGTPITSVPIGNVGVDQLLIQKN